MTPHKQSKGGSLMIDRSFRGIGRLHRASGMTRQSQFDAFNKALTEMALEPAGRDWIRALQQLEIEPLDLYARYRKNDWRNGPDKPIVRELLVKSVAQWREDTKAQVSDDTYRVRNELVTKLSAQAHATTTVGDIVAIMLLVRTAMATTPASFNLLRNYARAFLRDTVGERHPLYLDLKYDVKPIAIPQHALKKERKRHALTPAQVGVLASAFTVAKHGDVAIGMALTGMNPKEYWGQWSVPLIGVRIEGTKRGGRDRMVPKVFPSELWPHGKLQRPTITRSSWARAFRAAAKAAKLICSPIDLRRSFANWMAAAGLSENYRRVYRGHGARTMQDVYETPEFQRDLAEHGKQLRQWIDAQLTVVAGVALVKDGAR